MLLKNSTTLLAASILSGCATLFLGCMDPGPKIEVCVWNDDGSAECIQADGETSISKAPGALVNYVGTNASDQEKLLNWCVRPGGE